MRVSNPWLSTPVEAPSTEAAAPPRRAARSLVPQAPQAEGFTQVARGGLATWDSGPAAANPPWWWVGCHGGAGVGTLDALLPGGGDGGRAWPLAADGGTTRVVLVARANASGLRAAQLACRQWASGAVPSVVLLGLATVADAPGRPPKALSDLLTLVAGGFPHVWSVPWMESLRVGEFPDADRLPKPLRRMGADFARLGLGPSR